MEPDRPLPPPGFADIRIVAASPEAARQIAEALRRCFAGTEQRSYPTGPDGTGTLLHLTVDTARHPEPTESFRPWLVTSRSSGPGHPDADRPDADRARDPAPQPRGHSPAPDAPSGGRPTA